MVYDYGIISFTAITYATYTMAAVTKKHEATTNRKLESK